MKAVGKHLNSLRQFIDLIRKVARLASSRMISMALMGLAFSPDERRLYVSETGDQTTEHPRQYIRVFEVGENQSSLRGGGILHKVEPGYCDGMRVDEHGNIWSSAADGVHCINADGELLGKILVPYRVSNLTFGGLVKNRLFIGGSGTLYSIFLNCRGAQTP